MRIAGLIAMSVLVAACSQSVGGEAESPQPAASTVTSATPTSSPASTPSPEVPTASSSLDDVIAWIEAAAPADPATFHVAFRDGVTTRLGNDMAFVVPSGVPHGTTQCVTAAADSSTLTCLLELTSPPPAPAQAEGMWKPGWVEFSGTALSVGALRGDPGPFGNGTGSELEPGGSLAFADNRCRSDDTGLYCVNYAHRAAVRIAADGVVPFGCLAEAASPPETAVLFRC